MNNIDKAEHYRQEMMKLYGRRHDEAPVSPSVEEGLPQEDDGHFSVDDDEAVDTDDGIVEDYSSRFPEPDLSDIDTDTGGSGTEDDVPPEYPTEDSLGDSTGYIQVYARTGDSSSAVAGASVMVTAIVDGSRLIIASGVTDGSGAAPRFSVPVPSSDLSQAPEPSFRPYSLYDISVTAEGYFNARSVDVPVFEGITSVQNFSMIPVPSMMSGRDETLTYFNQEPF